MSAQLAAPVAVGATDRARESDEEDDDDLSNLPVLSDGDEMVENGGIYIDEDGVEQYESTTFEKAYSRKMRRAMVKIASMTSFQKGMTPRDATDAHEKISPIICNGVVYPPVLVSRSILDSADWNAIVAAGAEDFLKQIDNEEEDRQMFSEMKRSFDENLGADVQRGMRRLQNSLAIQTPAVDVLIDVENGHNKYRALAQETYINNASSQTLLAKRALAKTTEVPKQRNQIYKAAKTMRTQAKHNRPCEEYRRRKFMIDLQPKASDHIGTSYSVPMRTTVGPASQAAHEARRGGMPGFSYHVPKMQKNHAAINKTNDEIAHLTHKSMQLDQFRRAIAPFFIEEGERDYLREIEKSQKTSKSLYYYRVNPKVHLQTTRLEAQINYANNFQIYQKLNKKPNVFAPALVTKEDRAKNKKDKNDLVARRIVMAEAGNN